MAELATYLVASLLLGGYYLTKDGKQSRSEKQVRDAVPALEQPSGTNVYQNTRSKQVANDVLDEATLSYQKSRDPFNQNVIPPYFNVLGNPISEWDIEKNKLLDQRDIREKTFINEGRPDQEMSIDESPMFRPLLPAGDIRRIGSEVERSRGQPAERQLAGGWRNISNPAQEQQNTGSIQSQLQNQFVVAGAQGADSAPTGVQNGNGMEQFAVVDRKGSQNGTNHMTKMEHFSGYTIHGPRNSNDPRFHNNMVPFFGGKGTQNVNPEAQNYRLSVFTGQTNNPEEFRAQPKREIAPFSDLTPDQTYIYGTPADNVSRDKERYWTSNRKQNLLPTEQIRVAPGVNYGYDATGRDGFHPKYRPQFRNVDELRSYQPKNVYRGRVIAGKERVQNRGIEGRVFKRQPDRYYINHPGRWFRTTGAYTGPKTREQFVAYTTDREKTSVDYTGIASAGEGTRHQRNTFQLQGSQPCDVDNNNNAYAHKGINSEVQHTRRNQFPHDLPSNAFAEGHAHPHFDYGVGGYVAYGEERDTTEAARGAQRLNPFINQGQKVYPYDDARATTRQTLQVKDYMGSAGATEGTRNQQTYPYDDARVTTRQTVNIKDYFGVSGATEQTREPKSYEAMYNATAKNRMESLLEDRIPGPNKAVGPYQGACDVNMQITERTLYDTTQYGLNNDRQYQNISTVDHNFQNTTSQGNRESVGIRQPELYLVDQFEKNPYSQPLNSSPAISQGSIV